MKKLTLIFFACCLTCIAIGQETAEKKKKVRTATREWGVNASKLVALALRSNQNLTFPAPYVMSYKAIQQNGNTFRLGFGADVSGEVDFETLYKFDLRLGYERQLKLSPHALVYVGGDFITGFQNLDNDFSGVLSLGVGPVAGIQWMVHPKIGLHTETAFYYDTAIGFGGVHRFNLILPAVLYLTFRY